MSPRIQFPTGIREVGLNWETETFRFMLMADTFIPDPSTMVFVDDADPGTNEIVATGYARQDATGQSIQVTLPASPTSKGLVGYLADNPEFGILDGGAVAVYLVLYEFVTDDTDSILVAAYPGRYEANGADAATYVLSVEGAVVISTLCPSDL